ncbi:MAG: hypothetical protein ABIJ97_14705 [Bacteroidota bacterium]
MKKLILAICLLFVGIKYFAQNTGIGNVNFTPQSILHTHINAASGNLIQLTNTSTGLLVTDGMVLYSTGVDYNFNNREAGYMSFSTSNLERMRILSGGNVGIGLTAPLDLLHVKGVIRASNPSSESNYLQIETVPGPYHRIQTTNNFKIISGGSIDFSTNGSNERMIITTTGNVGIGTTTPSAQLHTTGTVRFQNYPSGANGAIVRTDVSGNLATTNFTGDVNQVLLGDATFGTASTSATAWQLTGNAAAVANFIGTTNAIDFRIYTNNLERMRVDDATGHISMNTATIDANSNLYVYRAGTDYGADKANIYGYRAGSGTATNGGTSWGNSGVDAAIKGYSYYGNNYSAGVAGYNYNDYTECAGVFGANSSATYWGALGYKDASSATWAGFFQKTSGAETVAISASGPELVLIDNLPNSATRPRIQYRGNSINIIHGDDVSDEEFHFYSEFKNPARNFDAKVRIHGKSSVVDDWGKYIELTHDGIDGIIRTDIGDIALMPAVNVGVGITTPATLLHIDAGAGNTIFRLGKNQIAGHGLIGDIEFYNSNGAGRVSAKIEAITGGLNINEGELHFYTSNNAAILSDRMVINENGNVGIGSSAPNASVILDVSSTTKGILIPRIALTASNIAAPVSTPVDALLIYNTATAGVSPNNVVPGYYFWSSASSKWNWLFSGNVPNIPGNVEYWIRPTAALYIQPMYNSNAKVYDAGQTWAYYYDGSNSKGSFFAGGTVGAVMHRAGVPSTNAPTFTFDQYPFIDVNNDYDITAADNVTYTGGYAYGDAYNGLTGIGALDAGVRGIGLGNTLGTNSSWPVVGVMGEVVATGSLFNGQQGVYGWQAAPAGAAAYCSGVLGRTSQTGYQSAGVAGYYSGVGDLTTCFGATMFGLLGNSSFGVYGNGGATTYGYLGASTQGAAGVYNANVYGIMGGAGGGAYGQYSSTNYGYLGSSGGYSVYGYNSGNWAGYFDGNTNIGNSTANLHRFWGVIRAGSTSDSHQINPNAGNWGYIGTAALYWYYSYAMSHVNVSKRELKREITPLDENLYAFVMNDIEKIKPSFYKYKIETDEMESGNEFKYRPNMHLGVILDEAPDYIQDNAFSGIDIYALSTLSLAGVKYNHQEIEKMKTTASDFGSSSISGNEVWIYFSEEFSSLITENFLPVITIAPYYPNAQLYISEKNNKGFKVRSENNANCTFDWIAMVKVENKKSVSIESKIPQDLLLQIRVPENNKQQMQDFLKNYESNIGNKNIIIPPTGNLLERPVPLDKMPEVIIDENAKPDIDKQKLENERRNK